MRKLHAPYHWCVLQVTAYECGTTIYEDDEDEEEEDDEEEAYGQGLNGSVCMGPHPIAKFVTEQG